LVGEHVELTETILNRLQRHGISFVYIHDERTDDIIVQDVISEETRRRALQEIRSTFRHLMDNRRGTHVWNNVQIGKQFKDVVTMILDELGSNAQVMTMLSDLNVKDHYLFQHSLNVCLYAGIVGMAHGYTRDELTVLALGAILHDIGKTQTPDEILLKPGPLTPEEFEIVKKHPVDGFALLKDIPNIPLISAHCALQHHERLDGSGYPRGLKSGEIHEYAQWIGIADVYDAMTSERVYREAMLPHQAMEAICRQAGTHFDSEKVALFRSKVAVYPIGLPVKLSTGESGIVVDLNGLSSDRPIVRVLSDAEGHDLQVPYEVDLSKNLTVSITGVVR
jgi:HD-GYP domain-containing protein (c-di-GMP phosphodiesterase class II)